jgi:hypothetical protein
MAFWCAESAAEGLDKGFAGCDDLFVGWERHVDNLAMVGRPEAQRSEYVDPVIDVSSFESRQLEERVSIEKRRGTHQLNKIKGYRSLPQQEETARTDRESNAIYSSRPRAHIEPPEELSCSSQQ